MTNNMKLPDPHRVAARAYGLFFILAFLSYGIGSGIVASIADSPNGLPAIQTDKALYTLGIILMAVVHTFVNIGLAVIMLQILKPYNKFATYGYFGAAVAATTVAVVGAIFMAVLVPLSDFTTTAGANVENLEIIADILKHGGFYSYQISMTIWGLGGLLFVNVLCKSGLVPKAFPIWGFVGYSIFIAGTTAELFGYGIGVLLSIPGGLFEITLSVWLIVKGFNHPAAKS